MRSLRPGHPALIGGKAGPITGRVDRRAAGKQRVSLRRAAVVGQGPQRRGNAGEIPRFEEAAGGNTVEAMAERNCAAVAIASEVVLQNAVGGLDGRAGVRHQTSAGARRVSGDGHVVQHHFALPRLQPPPVFPARLPLIVVLSIFKTAAGHGHK
jgi:hypothetical protein